MSFAGLLPHRGSVMRSVQTDVDGISGLAWSVAASEVRCRVDLSFIRAGKDPQWTPEAGRPSDRTGVLFLEPGVDIKVGDRFIVTTGVGVEGTFKIDGNLEQIIGHRGQVHHLEAGILEVAPAIARASGSV